MIDYDIINEIEYQPTPTMTKKTSFFWREQWKRLKMNNLAVPAIEQKDKKTDNQWGNGKKTHLTFLKEMDKDYEQKRENRLKSMNIPDGSRVLDIGSGPGTYTVPLAAQGCRVTAVEPSEHMRKQMEDYILSMEKEEIEPINTIPKRWEDVNRGELGEPFDVVIASYSILWIDIDEAISKMVDCCNGTIHLFWFMTPPPNIQVGTDLRPLIHGSEGAKAPMADILWQVLCEMGIYANLSIETMFPEKIYPSVESAVEQYSTMMSCETEAQERIVRNYMTNVLRKQDDDSYILGNKTLGAHIWWDNTSAENTC